MSYIDITTYDGDPEEYDRDEPETVGQVDEKHSFTDGEELAAATRILELLDEGTHFDVRHTRF